MVITNRQMIKHSKLKNLLIYNSLHHPKTNIISRIVPIFKANPRRSSYISRYRQMYWLSVTVCEYHIHINEVTSRICILLIFLPLRSSAKFFEVSKMSISCFNVFRHLVFYYFLLALCGFLQRFRIHTSVQVSGVQLLLPTILISIPPLGQIPKFQVDKKCIYFCDTVYKCLNNVCIYVCTLT